MRIDLSVPADQRTGLSVYYNDYKRGLAVDYSKAKPSSAFRKNKPHPTKNFLEPRRMPEEGAILQRRVREAVRNYLTKTYQSNDINTAGEVPHCPPLFQPPVDDEDLEPKILLSSSYKPPQDRVRSATNYQVQRSGFDSDNRQSLDVNGTYALRPSSANVNDRTSPLHLEGETKRDRSVRIKEAIKKSHRLPTPHDKGHIWQKARSTPIPPQNKPHWVGNSGKAVTKPKRIVSAPPGIKGYTFYPQGRKEARMEPTEDMTSKIEAWSKHASNYEKEVVFNMLQNVAPHPNQPSTPMSGDFTKQVNGPATDYHRPGYKPGVTMSYPPSPVRYEEKQKHRNVHSAPIKKMGGLVPAATQRPLHDQRTYRLKGQDTRLNPSPGEERELKEYMDTMDVSSSQVRLSKRRVNVPMHTYLPRDSHGKQDYQCKVSFFQAVRSPFKKHFVIHPDFTSESLKKRKPVSHTITHFRY